MKKTFIILLLLIISLVAYSTKYYAAPSGGNDGNAGTISSPFATVQKLIDTGDVGDTLYLRGGVWYPTVSIDWDPSVSHGNDGTPTTKIYLFNYPGEVPIIDFQNWNEVGNYNTALYLGSLDYAHIKGITIRNVRQTRDYVECLGFYMYDCTNITLENCTAHNIDGNAFRYFGGWRYPGTEPYDRPEHASYPYDSTFFINCDAYQNADSLPRELGATLGGSADGYKSYDEPGAVITYEGCRAWNCSDDGFDPTGPCNTIINNCWSFNNGDLGGDGTGFKVGGSDIENVTPSTIVTNCIAAGNDRWTGFFLLEYPDYFRTNARFYNNLSYANMYGFSVSNNYIGDPIAIWRNNIAYDNSSLDFASSTITIESNNTWDADVSYPGYITTDTVTVTDADFVSLSISQLSGARQADNSLPEVTFGHLVAGSDLIDMGIDVGMSAVPDLGVDWAYANTPPVSQGRIVKHQGGIVKHNGKVIKW